MDSAFDVPDATDWLNTPLKDFADLENALHCQICKEFYDTPMITSCAHTFCSKCIRTSLSADGKCPACRSADQASKLRNNWAIQEIVSTFLAARTPALQIARNAQEEKTASSEQRKRKRTQTSDADDTLRFESLGRTTRSKSRRLVASQGSQSEVIDVIDSDGDGNFEPDDGVLDQPDDGLVECPLGCGKRMKIEAVDPHLDRCEEERERDKRSKSRPPVNGFAGLKGSKEARPLERINELNYSLLKDSAMTKKLNELGIPSWGSKLLMMNRHREWVNIWNANCDSSNPRAKRELLQDLDVWERTQGGRAPNANGLSNSIMRKDFDGVRWAKKNHDDFSRLIADAKRKKHHPAMQSESSNKDEGSDADQAGPVSIQSTPAIEQALSDPSSSGLPTSETYADDPTTFSPVHAKLGGQDLDQHIAPVTSAATVAALSSPDQTKLEMSVLSSATDPYNLSAISPSNGSRKVPMFAAHEQSFHITDVTAEGKETS